MEEKLPQKQHIVVWQIVVLFLSSENIHTRVLTGTAFLNNNKKLK
jgi:hypothetical protein